MDDTPTSGNPPQDPPEPDKRRRKPRVTREEALASLQGRCVQCLAWDPSDVERDEDAMPCGYCHALPPAASITDEGTMMLMRPITRGDDYCLVYFRPRQ